MTHLRPLVTVTLAAACVLAVVGSGLAGAAGTAATPTLRAADELNPHWELATQDRRSGRVTPRTRHLRIEYVTGDCGTDNRKRDFKRIEVKRSKRKIVITVVVAKPPPRPPGTNCPSIGFKAVKRVDLRGRLGRRRLRDGSYDPPRRVASDPRCQGSRKSRTICG